MYDMAIIVIDIVCLRHNHIYEFTPTSQEKILGSPQNLDTCEMNCCMKVRFIVGQELVESRVHVERE